MGPRKRDERWKAEITVNGKCKHIGYFDDPTEGAKAYDHYARLYFGEFALCNFE